MLQAVVSSGNVPLLKQVAKFAERRQEVLAGNVANIDTPGYRLRDLPTGEFQQALTAAVEQLRQRTQPQRLAAASLNPPSQPIVTEAPLQEHFPAHLFEPTTPESQPGITFQDANNRSIEHQFLQMTKNSILQNFALQILQGQYDQLQTVIAERVA
jgi:flagellar basal-body rod protein FlgB